MPTVEQDWEEVGRRIRYWRTLRRMSQQALADILVDDWSFTSVDQTLVSRWEAGLKVSDAAYLLAMEQILAVDTPGALCRPAGFVPSEAVPPGNVDEAIAAADDLGPGGKAALIALLEHYRETGE